MTPNVIDIYHGDKVTDFGAVKNAGILGIIHKAHQGGASTGSDPAYAIRRKLARAQGLLWGAYHFMTSADVSDQTFWFLRSAFPDTFGEPDDETLIALDYEPFARSTPSLTQLRDMCHRIEDKCHRKAVIYSGSLLKETLGPNPDPYLMLHRLWLAEYATIYTLRPMTAWQQPWLWQYSGDGAGPGPHGVDGIAGHVDLNRYAGDAVQLAKEWAS
jgi:GH25 family lysozyme M1 (1,4-beta-N-acetylmuramidase)